MDSRTKSQKQELVQRLAEYRGSLKLPDPRQLIHQTRNLLQVAGKLPSSIHARPARTVAFAGGLTLLLVLLLKPKRKKRGKNITTEGRPLPSRPLFTFAFSILQPLARVWLTEQVLRRWQK